MISSGNGLTFTDDDLKQIRVVIGLLNRAYFKDLNASAIMEVSVALPWLQSLVGKIKDNIFDMSTAKLTEPKGE